MHRGAHTSYPREHFDAADRAWRISTNPEILVGGFRLQPECSPEPHRYFLTFCTYERQPLFPIALEGRHENADLKAFVVRMKQCTAFYFKKAFGRQLWQRYGYEHVIRHDEPTRAIIRYILENPIRAGLVRTVADYRFIGSSQYTVEQLVEYCRSSG